MPAFDATLLIVGTVPQYFFDNLVIDQIQDITRTIHSPQKQPDPILKRDKPWERNLYFTVNGWSVLPDRKSGGFRCWYDDWTPDPVEVKQLGYLPCVKGFTMLATSKDGTTWTKPELDYLQHDGKKTNVVSGKPGFFKLDSTCVFEDPLDPDPQRRFKMLLDHHFDPQTEEMTDIMRAAISERVQAEVQGTRDGRDGLTARVQVELHTSPDGVHWSQAPLLPRFGRHGNGLGDCYTVYPDVDAGVYRLLTRAAGMETVHYPGNRPRSSSFFPPQFPGDEARLNTRRVFLSQSSDLIHWSRPQCVLAPDPLDDNLDETFYGMCQFKLGEMYVGFMNILHQVDNTLDVRLMCSRDGFNWRHLNQRQPWLTFSEGSWDNLMVNVNSPPVAMGKEHFVFYGGSNNHHDWWITGLREGMTVPEALSMEHVSYALGLAKMRLDGFVSLDAGSVREGILITRALRTDALNLKVNARCGAGGYLRVEVTDVDDQPLEGFSRDECDTFTGDDVARTITWRGKSKIAHSGALRLRFFMRNASVFSFVFE
jgi:hypothetical protein